MEKQFELMVAATAQQYLDGRSLFEEYSRTLDFGLEFQQFDTELETMEVKYKRPQGALLLAYDGDKAVACLGIRKLSDDTAELKRMYVQPAYRGYQLGKKLLATALEQARELGYSFIRLDTLPHMEAAIRLYRSFGFYDIPAYCFNPFEEAMYMEARL